MKAISTLALLASTVTHIHALAVSWGQSSAPFRTIAAPFGVQDALRISKGGTRAVVVRGEDGHLNFVRQLAHYLSTQMPPPTKMHSRAGQVAALPLMGDVIGALGELAKDGLHGEAELACAEVHSDSDEANLHGGYLDVLAVGDCEVVVFRQCGSSGTACAVDDQPEQKSWTAVFKSGRGSVHVRSDLGLPLACAGISDKGIVLHGDLQHGARTARVKVQRGDVVLVGSDDLFGHLSEAEVSTQIARILNSRMSLKQEANDKSLATRHGGTNSHNAEGLRGVWTALRNKLLLRARPCESPACSGNQLARELVQLAKHNWRHPTGDITAIAGLVQ